MYILSLILGIVTLTTSIATIITAGVVLWQTIVSHRTLQFQAYIGLESLREGMSIREGILAINSLPMYTDYQMFLQKESLETQDAIYDTVTYLNDIAHLVNEGYLDKYQAWSRFFFSYRACYDKLYSWYTQGLRDTRYQGEEIAYATFDAMCILVHEVDSSKAMKKKLFKYQGKSLHLPTNKYTPLIHLFMRARPYVSKGIPQERKSPPENLDSGRVEVTQEDAESPGMVA